MSKKVKIQFHFSAVVELPENVHITDIEEVFSLSSLWAFATPLQINNHVLKTDFVKSRLGASVYFVEKPKKTVSHA